jgi:hypothetical protein
MSAEQAAQIPTYIDKWVGLASAPVDRVKAFERLHAIMPERVILFTRSISETVSILRAFAGKDAKFQPDLNEQLGGQLGRQLHEQLGEQLHEQLDEQLGRQLHEQLGEQLYEQLDEQPVTYSWLISYWRYSWAGIYDFAAMLGVEFDAEKHSNFYDLIVNAPITIFAGNVVFVVEKPAVKWRAQRLHCEQGKAIEWENGTGCHYLDGVHIGEGLFTKIIGRSLSAADVFSIQDADVRAVALKYGGEVMLAEGAELLDEHPTAGRLYRVSNARLNKFTEQKEIYLLRMECPSTGRVFVEPVEPEYARRHPYALHNQARRSGVPVEIYEQIRNHG